MHVSGEELPMHDPRLNPGLATSYQVDATPGRHTQWAHGFTKPVLPLPYLTGTIPLFRINTVPAGRAKQPGF